jgi:Flp pilus assembly pilin Flp
MNTSLQSMFLKVYDRLTSEEGQDLVEYALAILLIALACVAGVSKVASAINTIFSNISATLS